MKTSFLQQVRDYVKRIPAGEVRTYGEVSTACGSPGAARAVGSIMAKNYDVEIPCHRVVRADGSLGSYNRGGSAAKRKKLQAENVTVEDNKVVLNTNF